MAQNQEAYADAFIKSLDILFSVGGRMQSLQHDILAVINYGKRLIPIDLLGAISPNGGPPARDGSGRVENATAAFMNSIFQFYAARGNGYYQALKEEVVQGVCDIARMVLTAENSHIAYGAWRSSDK